MIKLEATCLKVRTSSNVFGLTIKVEPFERMSSAVDSKFVSTVYPS